MKFIEMPLSEYQELRAENERLRTKLIEGGPEDDWEERGAASELRAEIDRLRAVLRRIDAICQSMPDVQQLIYNALAEQ